MFNVIGYRVYIGKIFFVNDIFDGVIFIDIFIYVFNFELNNIYFVRIVFFNVVGEV